LCALVFIFLRPPIHRPAMGRTLRVIPKGPHAGPMFRSFVRLTVLYYNDGAAVVTSISSGLPCAAASPGSVAVTISAAWGHCELRPVC
jgi:hypothetical protein